MYYIHLIVSFIHLFLSSHINKLVKYWQDFIVIMPVINILIWGMYWLQAQSAEEGWIFQNVGGVRDRDNQTGLSCLSTGINSSMTHNKKAKRESFHASSGFTEYCQHSHERVHMKCHCNKWSLHNFILVSEWNQVSLICWYSTYTCIWNKGVLKVLRTHCKSWPKFDAEFNFEALSRLSWMLKSFLSSLQCKQSDPFNLNPHHSTQGLGLTHC